METKNRTEEKERICLPDVFVTGLDGTKSSLQELVPGSASLWIFFKQTCDTSLFFLDLLLKFWENFPDRQPPVYLISQDSLPETQSFFKNKGGNIPVFIDAPDFALSKRLNFRSVPASFLIDAGGCVLRSEEGFVRDALSEMIEAVLQKNQFAPVPVWDDPARIPILRPG